MAQLASIEDDKYFDLLCHVSKRGRADQLKTLLGQYNVKTHYSKRDASGMLSTFAKKRLASLGFVRLNNQSGQAPIHYAASYGQIDCIKLLLAKDSDLTNVRTKKDGTICG